MTLYLFKLPNQYRKLYCYSYTGCMTDELHSLMYHQVVIYCDVILR